MNSQPKRWFYPAQVFAQFTSSEGNPLKFIDKQGNKQENMENTSKVKTDTTSDVIEVFEAGEMTIAPDYAQVMIVCTSLKVVYIVIVWEFRNAAS